MVVLDVLDHKYQELVGIRRFNSGDRNSINSYVKSKGEEFNGLFVKHFFKIGKHLENKFGMNSRLIQSGWSYGKIDFLKFSFFQKYSSLGSLYADLQLGKDSLFVSNWKFDPEERNGMFAEDFVNLVNDKYSFESEYSMQSDDEDQDVLREYYFVNTLERSFEKLKTGFVVIDDVFKSNDFSNNINSINAYKNVLFMDLISKYSKN